MGEEGKRRGSPSSLGRAPHLLSLKEGMHVCPVKAHLSSPLLGCGLRLGSARGSGASQTRRASESSPELFPSVLESETEEPWL